MRNCANCLYGFDTTACANRDYLKCAKSKSRVGWRPIPSDKLSPSLRKAVNAGTIGGKIVEWALKDLKGESK